MKQKLKNFIIIGNNVGSISLLGACLTAILSLFLLFLVVKMQLEYREALYRKKSYLCFRYLNRQTETYIQTISQFNLALRSAYLAQFIDSTAASAKVLFKTLVIARNARHISYMKNLNFNPYCSFPETASFVNNLPYKTLNSFLLETNKDETTKIRAQEWKNIVTLISPLIRSSRIFSLEVTFFVEGEFSPKTKYQTREIKRMGLLN